MRTIHIDSPHLGAIKQTPYLIRSIIKIMPEVNIIVYVENDMGCCDYTKKILRDELDYKKIRGNIHFQDYSEFLGINSNQKNIKIRLNFMDSSLYSYDELNISFWIDPLKFEKRRLLNNYEIQKLKDKYKINSDKIILGSSLHHGLEFDRFINATRELVYQNKNSKIIIVPRKDPKLFVDDLKNNQIKFGVDSDNKGENYLLITEKGVLDNLSSICDIAVLGNTFNGNMDGQNPLEPAFYGKRMLAGKSSNNMNVAAYRGLEKSGLLKIIHPNDLTEEFFKKYSKGKVRKWMKEANEFIESLQGTSDIYAQIIKDSFEENLSLNKLTEILKGIDSKFSK